MLRKTSYGFTILELIIVIVIIVIVAAVTMPSYSEYINRKKVAKVARSFESALQFAKNQARVTGRPIEVCLGEEINTSPACLRDSSGKGQGWLIFDDQKLMKVIPFPQNQVKMLWNNNYPIVLNRLGRTGNAGTLCVYKPPDSSHSLSKCLSDKPNDISIKEVKVTLSSLGNISFKK